MAGPVAVDWHIFEQTVAQLGRVERSLVAAVGRLEVIEEQLAYLPERNERVTDRRNRAGDDRRNEAT